MINTLYLPELREMLAEENAVDLCEFCDALHPARTAEYMEGLTADEAWEVLQYAQIATRVEVFSYYSIEKQVKILETQNRASVAELIAELAADPVALPPTNCPTVLLIESAVPSSRSLIICLGSVVNFPNLLIVPKLLSNCQVAPLPW